jgi:hypothetical protein
MINGFYGPEIHRQTGDVGHAREEVVGQVNDL